MISLTLRDFNMAGLTFKHTRRLKRIPRLLVQDIITEAVRDIPETTTCEGDLRDPRCPVDGNGDIIDILLAAFDNKGELQGAVHFGAIKIIEKNDNVLVVETHATPAFPSLNETELAMFAATAAKEIFRIDLQSEDSFVLQVRALNYARETPAKAGGKFEAMHTAVMGEGLTFETKDDSTRAGRKLHSVKPERRVANRRTVSRPGNDRRANP